MEPDSEIEIDAPSRYNGKPVSALGYRLYKLREEIDAASERGEIKLLNRDEFDRLVRDQDEPD